MKRAIIFSLMLILLVSLSYAVPFTPQGNVDLKDYFNMTNLNYFDTFAMLGNINFNNYSVVNATDVNTTNVYATNNISSGSWISGFFDWATNSSYLDFNGSVLLFNESVLNSTVNSTGGLYFVRNTGDNMTGDLEMGENAILNISQLQLKTGENITKEYDCVVAPDGGIGDFIGSDDVSIQACIDYVYDNNLSTIYIKPGTYILNDNLVKKGNYVTVYGAGIEKTILKINISNIANFGYQTIWGYDGSYSTKGWEIGFMSLDGSATSDYTSKGGGLFPNSEGYFHDLYIYNTSYYPIFASGLNNTVFERIYFSGYSSADRIGGGSWKGVTVRDIYLVGDCTGDNNWDILKFDYGVVDGVFDFSNSTTGFSFYCEPCRNSTFNNMNIKGDLVFSNNYGYHQEAYYGSNNIVATNINARRMGITQQNGNATQMANGDPTYGNFIIKNARFLTSGDNYPCAYVLSAMNSTYQDYMLGNFIFEDIRCEVEPISSTWNSGMGVHPVAGLVTTNNQYINDLFINRWVTINNNASATVAAISVGASTHTQRFHNVSLFNIQGFNTSSLIHIEAADGIKTNLPISNWTLEDYVFDSVYIPDDLYVEGDINTSSINASYFYDSEELLTKTVDCVVDVDGNGDSVTLEGCLNKTEVYGNSAVIYMRTGVYDFQGTMNMSGNITLYAYGAILNITTGASNSKIVIQPEGNYYIYGLTIDMNGLKGTAIQDSGEGDYFFYGKDITVLDYYTWGLKFNGKASSLDRVYLDNFVCYANNTVNNECILSEYIDDITITNSRFYSPKSWYLTAERITTDNNFFTCKNFSTPCYAGSTFAKQQFHSNIYVDDGAVPSFSNYADVHHDYNNGSLDSIIIDGVYVTNSTTDYPIIITSYDSEYHVKYVKISNYFSDKYGQIMFYPVNTSTIGLIEQIIIDGVYINGTSANCNFVLLQDVNVTTIKLSNLFLKNETLPSQYMRIYAYSGDVTIDEIKIDNAYPELSKLLYIYDASNGTTVTINKINNYRNIGTITAGGTATVVSSYSDFTDEYGSIISSNLTFSNYSISQLENVNATYINGNSTWVHQSYPAACPGSGAITQLGDSVTCQDLWVDEAGDQMTGNLIFTSGFGVNASYILNEPWINDSEEGSLNVNSSSYWDALNTPADIAISALNSSGQENLNVNSSSYWDALDSPSDILISDLNSTGEADLNVNNSKYWIGISSINTTVLSNTSGMLGIVQSWWNGVYCQLTGCTMSGDIDMGNNDILNWINSSALNYGIVGFWGFDSNGQASDTDMAYDSSIYINNGTLGNDTEGGTDTYEPSWVAGYIKSALEFDSSASQYVVVPNDEAINITNNLTILVTLKRDAISSWMFAVGKWSDSSNKGYRVGFRPDNNKVDFRVGNVSGGVAECYITSNTAISDSNWHTIAAVFDPSIDACLKLYIDGELDVSSSGVCKCSAIYNSTADLHFGRNTDGYYYDGVIDDVLLYNRSLSANEIKAYYLGINRPIATGHLSLK